MVTQIRDIWRGYGFSTNPYHTDHLDATEQDADFYVSRNEAETQLGNFLASKDHGAIFVEGHVGVGKTTFVNQTQYRLLQDEALARVLPSSSLVEVQDDTSAEELILSILTSVLKALRQHSPGVEEDERFQDLEAYNRQARITTWTGGANVLGVGGSFGKTVTPTQPVTVPLQTLQDLLDEVAELASTRGFDKIVVLLNNLDNVDDGHFFSLLHDLRDSLLGRSGWLYVMAGPIGLRRALATDVSHRRISERIASEAVALGPLSKEGVHEVLRKRIEHYRLDPDIEAPVPQRVIDVLYDASGGEIRYVLNRADGMARMAARDLPSLGPIDEELALAALQKLVRDEIEGVDLTGRQWDVLEQIVEAGGVQPKDHGDFGLNSSQSLNNYLSPFHQMGLVEREQSGRETIYTPRGDVTLYFQGAQ